MKKEITINNIYYSEKELLLKCNSIINTSTEEWEKDIYIFIKQWIDKSENITAHTSGSTGRPKNIIISKSAMEQSALATGHALDLKKSDKALLCLSANFIAGKMMIVRAFVLGLNIFFQETNSKPLNNTKEYFDFAAMIPLQVENSLDYLNKNILNKLIIGGASIDNKLEIKLVNKTTNIYATFGMTETLSHIALRKIDGKNKIFTAIDNVEFTKDKRDCLTINAQKISVDKIFTNDIIELISTTQFIWLARYDNIINSGGLKFFPEQIEKKLSSLININFFVSGIRNKTLGEEICIFLEGKEYSIEEKNIFIRKLNKQLGKFEAIRKIFFIKNFEWTKNKKINRKATLLGNKLS